MTLNADAYRLLIERSPLATALVRVDDGRIEFANNAMALLLLCDTWELVGGLWRERIHPDDVEASMTDRVRLELGDTTSVTSTTRLVTRTAHPVTCNVTTQRIDVAGITHLAIFANPATL